MADINGTALSDFTFAAPAVGQVEVLNVYEAIAILCRDTGKDVYVGEAIGEVEVPYAVVSMDWEPEPDIGQVMRNQPSMQRISVQINSYGRANRDALWLDAAIYTLLMEPVAQIPGHRVVWWDGDESPVLTRTRYGLILCKHWYRLVYTREGV